MRDARGRERDQYAYMTETPVLRLVLTLAVPTTLSSLVTNIYNMADTYFVGRAGTSASGAVGVIFGLSCIIHAVGFMHGQGSGSSIARALGAHDDEKASVYASTGFFLAFFIGLLITVLGLVFMDPMCRILGSTETILPYARTYAFWILLAAPFMASSNVANNLLRYEGKAFWAMVGLVSGALINIFLDWLFVVRFGWGVGGAGAATAVSQIFSFALLTATFFIPGRTQSKLRFSSLRRTSWSVVRQIWAVGSPSLARQGLNSISTIVLNLVAGLWGDAAIAAMAIVNKATNFMFCVAIGTGQGFQPVSAFNYGAGRYDRVKEGFHVAARVSTLAISVISILGFIFAPQIVRFMRDDPAVVGIGSFALRAACVSLPFMAASVIANMLFQSIGKAGKAFLLSSLRSGLLFVPLLLLFVPLFGLKGLQTAQPVANVLTFAIAYPLALSFLRTLPSSPPGR